jgi:hypothetical protein
MKALSPYYAKTDYLPEILGLRKERSLVLNGLAKHHNTPRGKESLRLIFLILIGCY